MRRWTLVAATLVTLLGLLRLNGYASYQHVVEVLRTKEGPGPVRAPEPRRDWCAPMGNQLAREVQQADRSKASPHLLPLYVACQEPFCRLLTQDS